MLPRMQAGIEATRPLPLINVDRNSRAFADRAHMHVVEIDVPCDSVRIVGAAAGEAGKREAALTCQPDTGKQTTSRIRKAEKNDNFCSNDQKERDLAYGDLCLRLHPS
jgi:hypothetical protein